MLQLQDSDCDIVDAEELDSLFSERCRILHEHKLQYNNQFILHLSGTVEANCNLAVGLSNNLCEIYNFSNNQVAKIASLEKNSGGIVGVCFSPDNSNLLYSASAKNYINLWDLRDPQKLVSQFTDTTVTEPQNIKPLQCFDVSPSNRLLAGGTEVFGSESFILFWDIRNTKLLGGYWDSHTNDITQVKFHPEDRDTLSSGSTDGLINIYDISKSEEDDALLNSLNTDSSVEQVVWYRYRKKDCVSAVTHTADIQIWERDAVEPFVHFKRESIGSAIKRKSSDHCYIASTHAYDTDKIFLLAASNWNNGECLRALKVDNVTLEPLFLLKENKQRVRCSWYNEHHKMLVTGGESPILNFWNIDLTK